MVKFEIKDGVGIIPEGTTEIGYKAFEGCSDLSSIVIPDSVSKIDYGAFENCINLKYIQIGKKAYERCKSSLPEGVEIQLLTDPPASHQPQNGKSHSKHLESKLKTIGDGPMMFTIFFAGLGFVSSLGAFSGWKDDGLLIEWIFSFAGFAIMLAGLLMLMDKKNSVIRKGQWVFLVGSLFIFVTGLFVDQFWILGVFFMLIAIANIITIKVRNRKKESIKSEG